MDYIVSYYATNFDNLLVSIAGTDYHSGNQVEPTI